MLAALVADLAAIASHQLVVTADSRFPMAATCGVHGIEIVTLPSLERQRAKVLDRLMSSVDAAWLVAPETHRCLERLAAMAERKGIALLGSSSSAIRMASDKACLPHRLARLGVAHPKTRVVHPSRSDWRLKLSAAAGELEFPIVVKPARGAGCEGVSLARDIRELRAAAGAVFRISEREPIVLQQYVRGAAASVSLLADGRRAVALATNGQLIRRRAGRPAAFAYGGGTTPIDHVLAGQAVESARRICEAIPGLRGYIGVDLLLTKSEAFVIEVNPRLTTAYLGVRAAMAENMAAMALAACDGLLPASPVLRRHVRFTAAGRIIA
jgi:predicted ATP-grasp superfamily ATP-dependent carboligase